MREPTTAELRDKVRRQSRYWQRWDAKKAEIEYQNRQAFGKPLPPWTRPWFLSDELEQLVARELSERPMHGVPSSYREDILDKFDGDNSITADIGSMPFMRAATLLNRIAPCADIIGEYTRGLRGSVRNIAIEDILQACAETPLEVGDQPRAWLRAVCQEIFGYRRTFV